MIKERFGQGWKALVEWFENSIRGWRAGLLVFAIAATVLAVLWLVFPEYFSKWSVGLPLVLGTLTVQRDSRKHREKRSTEVTVEPPQRSSTSAPASAPAPAAPAPAPAAPAPGPPPAEAPVAQVGKYSTEAFQWERTSEVTVPSGSEPLDAEEVQAEAYSPPGAFETESTGGSPAPQGSAPAEAPGIQVREHYLGTGPSERPPPPPSDSAPSGAPRAETAGIDVFAPSPVRREQSFLVQVFFFAPSFASLVAEMAKESDEEASRRARDKVKLVQGRTVGVVLEMRGAEVPVEPVIFQWDGEWAAARFAVRLPRQFEGDRVAGRARIVEDGKPVGSISFLLKVVEASTSHAPERLPTVVRQYSRGFISYASKDREEAAARAQGIAATGLPLFFDRTNLGAGEEFWKRIFSEIEACNVFFLCWSQNAAESEGVKLEMDHALKRQHADTNGEPDIIPIRLPGPTADPPEPLKSRINFDDVYYQTILATQRQKELDRKDTAASP